MTGKDILNAVSQTEEEYISRSEDFCEIKNEFKKAKTKKIKTALSVCGCAVLVAAAAFAMRSFNGKPALPEKAQTENGAETQIVMQKETAPPENTQTQGSVTTLPAAETGAAVTVPDIQSAGSAEIYQVPDWNSRTEIQKYTSLRFNSTEYSVSGNETDAGFFGEQLGTAEAFGFDMYTDSEYKTQVAVYAIKGVSPSCGVGVKFADGVCAAYVDPFYVPETLGQFLSDLGGKENIVFGKAYAEYFDCDKKYHSVDFSDFDDSAVWETLFSDGSVKNNTEHDDFVSKLADISANVPALGIVNKALWITEDGYICTNLLETGKYFCIGAEKAEAFADYLYKNVPYTDTVPDFSGGGEGKPEIAEEEGEPEIAEEIEIVTAVAGAYVPE